MVRERTFSVYHPVQEVAFPCFVEPKKGEEAVLLVYCSDQAVHQGLNKHLLLVLTHLEVDVLLARGKVEGRDKICDRKLSTLKPLAGLDVSLSISLMIL